MGSIKKWIAAGAVYAIAILTLLILGIWTGDERWSWTAATLAAPVIIGLCIALTVGTFS